MNKIISQQEYNYIVEFLKKRINIAIMKDDNENMNRLARALIAFESDLDKDIFVNNLYTILH